MNAGDTFAGRYRLDRILGEGGFKTVWQAHDTRLSRDVALATFGVRSSDAHARDELLREARALAALSENPRIVSVYDADEHQGTPHLVMRLMTGGDVASLLDR